MTDGGASDEERVLLVEGRDDMHVVLHLSRSSLKMPPFSIREKDGVPALVRSIRGEILVEERTALGILVDANDDPNARWQAVVDRIRATGMEPPSSPDPGGTIIAGRPRVGIWMMPDNKSPGELEDFIAEMIPHDDAVWPLSEDYVNGIPEADRKFAEGKTLRAKVNAWLATRSDPRPMGLAIGAGDLNTQGEVSNRFVSWLRRLYE